MGRGRLHARHHHHHHHHEAGVYAIARNMMANAMYADNARRLSANGGGGAAAPGRQSELPTMLLSDWNGGAASMLPFYDKHDHPSTSTPPSVDMSVLLSSAGGVVPFADDAWTMMTHDGNGGKTAMTASSYLYDTEHHFAQREASTSASPPYPSARSRPSGKTSPSSTSSDGGVKSTTRGAASQKKRKRKQNQSCDQCRNSKRACNLSAESTGPCSTCETRQLECSTEWLRSRQRTSKGKQEDDEDEDTVEDAYDAPADKRIHRSPAMKIKQEDTFDMSAVILGNGGRKASLSGIAASLSKDTLGTHVKSCKLRIYLGVLEHPFSHWLGNGCSPHMHGLELVAASPQKILQPFMLLTTGMLSTISDSSAGPRQPIQPQIVQALGLLDAFLLVHGMQRRGVNMLQVAEDSPRWRKIRQTNQEIDDALTWAAIANSCQFSGGGREGRKEEFDRTQAIALWEMARNVLFQHVSSSSFRVAFAFVIFGITTPPRWDETGSSQPQPSEDVVFAIGHGVRTLRKQSVFVKQVLNTLHFEPGAAEGVHDGVWPMSMHAPVTAAANALSWFCDLAEAAIGTVMKRCRVYQCERETLDVDDDVRSANILDSLTAQMSSCMSTGGGGDGVAGHFLFPSNGGGSEDDAKGVAIAFTPSPLPDFTMEMGSSWQIDSPWKRVWLRSHQASMMESMYGACNDDGGASLELMHCAPHSVLTRVRNASAFKALIWKAVSDLEPFILRCGTGQSRVRDAIRYFNAQAVARELAKQWNMFYHTFIESTMQAYSSLAPEEKTMFGFLVHHIHLAYFYLDDLDQRALSTCFDPQRCGSASEAAQIAVLRERFLEAIKHRRAFGRVEDAKFVARICEQAQLSVALNNAITADHAEMGLDAELIASKPMGQWSHPFPPTLIQAQAHAADVLLSEAEIVSLELLNDAPNDVAQRHVELYELLKHADHCLYSLHSLQQAMFAFPSHALGGQRTVADMQRRRAALQI